MDSTNPMQLQGAGGYGSEFEYDSEADNKRKRRADLAEQSKTKKVKVASREEVTEEYSKDEGRRMRLHFLCLDAYSRHKKLVNDYLLYYGGDRSHFQRDITKDKRDIDVIRENHQFLWDDDEDEPDTWEKRLAKKYYDKLFKEYCIIDLSRYKENKVAMRWRIDKEVVTGKGQFECGEKRCTEREGLRSWEVNFGYVEQGEKKNALVKLRLCPDCSYKLNYHKKKREVLPKSKRKRGANDDLQTEKDKVDKDVQNKETTDAKEDKNSGESSSKDQEKSAEETWSGSSKITEEKSMDDEFEEYLEDMFL